MTITDLPPTARLILMIGPNGCGKSSIFDAFKVWHQQKGGGDAGLDDVYHLKNGLPPVSWDVAADIQFHEEMPTGSGAHKKIFYVRSAYRNEPDFTSQNINRQKNILDAPKVRKLIEDDRTVSNNYQRIVGATIESVYGGEKDELSVKDLREECIGQVRASMSRVFADLLLSSPGNPLDEGAFFFEKGATVNSTTKTCLAEKRLRLTCC